MKMKISDDKQIPGPGMYNTAMDKLLKKDG